MLNKFKTLIVAAAIIFASGAWKIATHAGAWAVGYGATRAAIHTAQNTVSDSEVEKTLKGVVVELEKNLPQKLDEYTTLVSASAKGRAINYNMNILMLKEDLPEGFVDSMTDVVCGNLSDKERVDSIKKLLRYDVALVYNYTDIKGDFVTTVTIRPGTCKALNEA